MVSTFPMQLHFFKQIRQPETLIRLIYLHFSYFLLVNNKGFIFWVTKTVMSRYSKAYILIKGAMSAQIQQYFLNHSCPASLYKYSHSTVPLLPLKCSYVFGESSKYPKQEQKNKLSPPAVMKW